MRRVISAAALTSVTLLGACAQTSDQIPATYVSPMQFADYSCTQLRQEAQRVSSEAGRAMGAQNQAASSDQATMAVTMVLFWPAVFFLNGKNAATEAEVGHLKGEMQAIEQASIQRNCGIQFQTQPGAAAAPAAGTAKH